VQISLFYRTKIVTAFEGTPQETRVEIRVQGREGTIIGMRVLPSRNNSDPFPVPEA
jgi:hypothetical protein